MRITETDVKSLTFACILIGSVAEQTLDDSKRAELLKHRDKIRKMYLILLNTSSQGFFDAESATHRGVPDNSIVAKGIRTVCPTIED